MGRQETRIETAMTFSTLIYDDVRPQPLILEFRSCRRLRLQHRLILAPYQYREDIIEKRQHTIGTLKDDERHSRLQIRQVDVMLALSYSLHLEE
jgi:hypothetical protein